MLDVSFHCVIGNSQEGGFVSIVREGGQCLFGFGTHGARFVECNLYSTRLADFGDDRVIFLRLTFAF